MMTRNFDEIDLSDLNDRFICHRNTDIPDNLFEQALQPDEARSFRNRPLVEKTRLPVRDMNNQV